MGFVTFDAERFASWREGLHGLATAGEQLSGDEVVRSLAALDSMLVDATALAASPSNPSHLPVLPDNGAGLDGGRGQRRSMGTQLHTVHPIYYSHHVLNKIRRERQVSRLTRRLGELAAALYTVTQDLWNVLLRAAPRVRDRHTVAPQQQRCTRWGAAMSPASLPSSTLPELRPLTLSDVLPPFAVTTREALRVFCGGSAEVDVVTTRLCHSPESRTEASTQTPPEFMEGVACGASGAPRMPFLCRRCRQDGRADYAVDRERMRLMDVGGGDDAAHRKALAPIAPPRKPPPSTTSQHPSLPPPQRGVAAPRVPRASPPHF